MPIIATALTGVMSNATAKLPTKINPSRHTISMALTRDNFAKKKLQAVTQNIATTSMECLGYPKVAHHQFFLAQQKSAVKKISILIKTGRSATTSYPPRR
jgi:hypothetical protein